MANIIKIHNKKFSRLQLGIIIVALTLVLTAAFFFFRPQPITPAGQVPMSQAEVASEKLYLEADKAATLGDYEQGQSILDVALKNKTTDLDRSNVYGQKSILASNNLKNEDAITFAKKSEALSPTRLTAHILAQVAEQAGDKTLALKYYKLTLERTSDQQKKLSPDDFDDLQAKVAELSRS